MKTLLFLVLLVCAGCNTTGVHSGKLIQHVLDDILPPDFKGPLHVAHKNGYFSFTIDAAGLARGPAGWTYTWLSYSRYGFVSNGDITLGVKP